MSRIEPQPFNPDLCMKPLLRRQLLRDLLASRAVDDNNTARWWSEAAVLYAMFTLLHRGILREDADILRLVALIERLHPDDIASLHTGVWQSLRLGIDHGQVKLKDLQLVVRCHSPERVGRNLSKETKNREKRKD